MPIVLIRVDERLIHGQVVVGWGGHLRPHRYLVVDRMVAGSEWEQELYRLGVPERVEADFLTPESARDQVEEWKESELRSVVLTRDIATMAELARGGRLTGEAVNLGGLHSKKGREEKLPYLFLGEEDRTALRELSAEGVEVTARDLPGSPKVSLESLLG